MPGGYQRIGPLALLPPMLAEFGVAAADVLRACGLSDDALENPENAITYNQAADLIEASVAATQCPHLGLLIGQRVSWTNLGIVGVLLRNAPNLGAGLRDFVANHHRFVRGGMLYLLPQDEGVLFGYAIYQTGVARIAHVLSDIIVAAAFRTCRELGDVEPLKVLLARDSPADAGPYSRYYGVKVVFNASVTGIVYSARALEHPIANADATERRIAQRRVDEYYAAGVFTAAAQVRQALMPIILFGKPSIEAVCHDLGLHRRTLNCQLEAELTTFRDELERLRFEVAQQLLGDVPVAVEFGR